MTNEALIAADKQQKHLTLDELNKAAADLEAFHEAMVAASGMVMPEEGAAEEIGAGRIPEVPPVEVEEPVAGGGGAMAHHPQSAC